MDEPDESNIDSETPCLGRWKSHYNGFAEARYKPYHGIFFGPEQEVWRLLRPGYRLAVFRCAETGGWTCEVGAVRFTTWEWYNM
jgi:hypothetical protein